MVSECARLPTDICFKILDFAVKRQIPRLDTQAVPQVRQATIGPYRRLITRHELGGWNAVSDAHEQAQTDARQGGCR